jgi:hypothetical protein
MCAQIQASRKVEYPNLGEASFRDWAISRFPRYGGGRYFAGNTSREMVDRVQSLKAKGFPVIIDLLGEEVKRVEVAEGRYITTKEVAALIRDLDLHRTTAMAVRPGQFGYNYGMMERIVDILVRSYGIFTWVDMEHTKDVNETIASFLRLMNKHGNHIGMAYQAYLNRTPRDRDRLLEFSAKTGTPLHLRITRGVYVSESDIVKDAGIDVTQKLSAADKRIFYLEMHKRLAQEIAVVGSCGISTVNLHVATHEPVQLATAAQLFNGGSSRIVEAQVLLGVYSPDTFQAMRDFSGMPFTIYVPFGPSTYKYIKRRFEEAGGAVMGLLAARICEGRNRRLFEFVASNGVLTEPFDPMQPFQHFQAGDPTNYRRMQAILRGEDPEYPLKAPMQIVGNGR